MDISNGLGIMWITYNGDIYIKGANETRIVVTLPNSYTNFRGGYGCCVNEPVLFNYYINNGFQVSLKNTWQNTGTTVSSFKYVVLFD